MAHPLDEPLTTIHRRRTLLRKHFLRRIYGEWYDNLLAAVPSGAGKVLEIGSGAGFFAERCPEAITSEVLAVPGVSLLLDAGAIPFRDASLRAIVMTDVFHHIPRAGKFLREAARVVRPGGVVAMVEPWNTPWSRWIYRRLHHEPFRPDAESWEFASDGPLSGANGALPWIVFHRDRSRFDNEFPQWRVREIRPMMPLRYLLSGGFTAPGLQPGFLFPAWRGIEAWLGGVARRCGMFALILLERRSDR